MAFGICKLESTIYKQELVAIEDDMTKQRSLKKYFSVLVCALCVILALAGCTVQAAGTSTDEHAAENRQYMALLNQKTGELDEVLGKFQEAVSAGDAVGMKAAASDATKIVEAVANMEATMSLSEVKDAYVEGLQSIDASMNEYAELYASVAAGTISQATFNKDIKAVQESYDKAIEQLNAADEILTQLANE